MINSDFVKEVGPLRWLSRNLVRRCYKAAPWVEQTIRLPTGQRFKLPPQSKFATEVYITGANVDWGSEALLVRFLSAEGDFLDIGANIGYYSVYVLPKVRSVYSFEPDPRTQVLLKQNIGAHPQAHLVPKAVGAQPGKARFVIAGNTEVSHLLRPGESSGQQLEVDVVTVDEYVQEHELNVTGMKIDVEGFDIDVVRGAVHTMRTQQPLMLTEAPPVAEIFDIAQSVDYQIYAFVHQPGAAVKRLQRLHEPLASKHLTKMLFLVPPRLQAQFGLLQPPRP